MASVSGVARAQSCPSSTGSLHFSVLARRSRDESRMTTDLLIHISAPVLAAFAGGGAGWWLRGRPSRRSSKTREAPKKQQTSQILQNLQAAAETVRSCIE